MYSRTTLGNYYPVNSIVHRLNPVNKIFCLILFIVFICCSLSLKLHFICLGFLVFIMLISLVPFRFYFNIIFSLRYIIIVLGLFFILSGLFSIDITIVVLLKVLMVVITASVLTFTTSLSELSYGIEKIISPLNLFNINFSYLINSLINLIRFIPMFITTEYSVLKAVESRGINYSYTNLVNKFLIRRKMFGSVFVITRQKLKNIKNEANLRMFSYKKYRTNYKVNKYRFYDLCYTLFYLTIIIVHLYERGIIDAILIKLKI